MQKMIKLWIEWDFGQDSKVFSSIDNAKNWLSNDPYFKEFLSENKYTFEELEDNGLITYESLTVD